MKCCCGCRALGEERPAHPGGPAVRQAGLPDLKKLGVVLKRARFFLICRGKSLSPLPTDDPAVVAGAIREGSPFHRTQLPGKAGGGLALDQPEQLSLFAPTKEDGVKCLTGQI